MTVVPTPSLAPLDPSKLIINLTDKPSTLTTPKPFGSGFTDHMLTAKFVPGFGWEAPKIGPLENLSLHPASSVLHYAPACFEGMKAYKTAEGGARLFRPIENAIRLNRSAARVGLPQFDPEAFVSILQTLVKIDSHLIPSDPGCLYLRPTMIGTAPQLAIDVDESCTLFVILSPVGPLFNPGSKGISILANLDTVRAWPGGTGDHKLAGNYAPAFLPQQKAKELGYNQNLWCFENLAQECGGMNLFVVVKSEDGVTRLLTPPLNGQILPGITRDSLLRLTRAHIAGEIVIEGLPTSNFAVEEREFTLQDLRLWSDQGRLLECFGAGTAVLITPVGRIGIPAPSGEIEDITVATALDTGIGAVTKALLDQVSGIQQGRRAGPKGWSVLCQ